MLNSFFLSDDCSLSVAIISGHTLQFFPQVYDPLHIFLRSVLFGLLCTKMSARFLCRLNAMIDSSGKTDFILSDLWRIDIRCCTILLISGRALEYVMTNGTLSFFFLSSACLYSSRPSRFLLSTFCSCPFFSLLGYPLLLSWPTSFFFPFDNLHPCLISASRGCQAHMVWPSLMWYVLTLCEDMYAYQLA